jgi:hypothetical protein
MYYDEGIGSNAKYPDSEKEEEKVLRIETKTKLSQDETMKRALQFFHNHRMKLVDQSADCASFEGAGGGVSFSTKKENNLTSIEFVSREWDQQVKDFIELLPHKVIEKEPKGDTGSVDINLGSDEGLRKGL